LRPSQTIRIVSIGKSSEMVDLTVNKSEKYGQIKALSKEATEKKHILRISKLALLNYKNKVHNLTKNDYSTLLSAHQTPRAGMSVTAASSPSSRPLKKGPFLAADGQKQ